MPTYEYRCDLCQGVFDVFQSIKARPLRKTHCQACGAVRPVKRLVGTGGAVLFKGSGFYQTDYRSESYKSAAKSENQAAEPAAVKDSPAAADSAASKPAEPKPADPKPDKGPPKKTRSSN